ncbi:MAG: PAS domain S-box protein, partial [Candidatus Hydrogenedentota bacterium]
RNTKLHYLRKQLKTTFIAIATGGSIAIMDFIVQTIYPLQNFSLTVIGIDITLATMAYAILKYNTATVVPSSVYSIIINSMDEALFLVDHDVIRFVNRAASLLSGYSETELLGKNLNTLIEYAKDIESSPEEQFFADNMINLNFLHKSGKKIPIYLSATTFRDSQSSNSVVCLVHDMTYYKKLVVKIYEAEKNLREKMNIIKKDMQIAKAVSSTFLPKKAPTIANIICDYRFQPLDEIGGDFFSFRELSEGGVGFFIGDVTGHGVAASLFLSMLRVITDQVCGMYGTNPKAYINELNARLNSIMQSNFVTGIYAHFDNRKKGNCIVRLARAGHPEPIVYKKADNKAYYLESRGALLGLRKETHTEEVQLTLQSRDRIFFYTDGIVEVTDESKTMLGEKRFLELFEENQDNNLSKTLDKIIEKVYEFSPTNQVNDDILLIGFEVV